MSERINEKPLSQAEIRYEVAELLASNTENQSLFGSIDDLTRCMDAKYEEKKRIQQNQAAERKAAQSRLEANSVFRDFIGSLSSENIQLVHTRDSEGKVSLNKKIQNPVPIQLDQSILDLIEQANLDIIKKKRSDTILGLPNYIAILKRPDGTLIHVNIYGDINNEFRVELEEEYVD